MIDLNQAEQQKEFSGGAIPRGSMVLLKMEIQAPKAGKQSDQHRALSSNGNGNHFLAVECKVIAGSYMDSSFYQNFVVMGSTQASAISMRTIRAIVEAVRSVDKNDNAPNADSARRLNDWGDLHGMVFPAVVGYTKKPNQAGYINNTLARVLEFNHDPEFGEVMNGGEVITDAALPPLPEQHEAQAANSGYQGPPTGGGYQGPPASQGPPSSYQSPPASQGSPPQYGGQSSQSGTTQPVQNDIPFNQGPGNQTSQPGPDPQGQGMGGKPAWMQ